MKQIGRVIAISALLLWPRVGMAADAPAPVVAKTYIVSEGLLNEILGVLSKESYANVATVIAHIQAEAMHQPIVPAPAEAPKPEK